MKNSRISLLAAAAGTLLAAEGCAGWAKTSPPIDTAGAATDRKVMTAEIVDQWSDLSALAARSLIEEYGVPDEADFIHLAWNNKGPWRRTVVRNVPPSGTEGKNLGIVEQTVRFVLPPEQGANLSAFDGSLTYAAASGELSARSDREAYNFLRLNLADDVVHKRMSPDEARNSYFRILALEESGKTSPDLLGLRLTP